MFHTKHCTPCQSNQALPGSVGIFALLALHFPAQGWLLIIVVIVLIVIVIVIVVVIVVAIVVVIVIAHEGWLSLAVGKLMAGTTESDSLHPGRSVFGLWVTMRVESDESNREGSSSSVGWVVVSCGWLSSTGRRRGVGIVIIVIIILIILILNLIDDDAEFVFVAHIPIPIHNIIFLVSESEDSSSSSSSSSFCHYKLDVIADD